MVALCAMAEENEWNVPTWLKGILTVDWLQKIFQTQDSLTYVTT
jgi:hypothetical protein